MSGWLQETDSIFFVLNRNKSLCPIYTTWMWKAICFPARKNCTIIPRYPGTSLFNCKVIDNKIHLSLPLFLVFKHHSCYFYYCCYEYVMKGAFVIVLAGVPLYVRKKLYPQKLLISLFQRETEWDSLYLSPPHRTSEYMGWCGTKKLSFWFQGGAFSQVMLNRW